jgi:endonuclease YncB( thermonuclease family)
MSVPPKTAYPWPRSAVALVVACAAGMAAHESTAASRSVAKAPARGPECPTAGTRVVGFSRAVDGGGFLTADGEEIRLSGVLAPGAGGETAPAGTEDAARDSLTAALRDKTISLTPVEQSSDRYGRALAQVFADGVWVQAALLRTGDVRAAPDLASAPCAKALLAAEAEARDGRLANWRGGFRVRDPDDIANRTGTFQIVEATVTTASVTRGRAYINFGADYRTDFTVTVDPDDMKTFRQAKFDVRTLAGKRIRVRGWVEFYNGPEITITTPAAIEVL